MSEYIEREAFLAEQRHLYCENCARRKGMKNGKMRFVYDIGDAPCRACDISDVLDAVEDAPAADVREVPEGGIGEMSDGYHTFNGLYYQRLVLFAALAKAYKSKAWKSHRHEDGELCFGGRWFIVGIDTPEGSYTYHYEDKDWGLFDCVELPVAKHWDGHTEKDVTRLLSLDVRPVVRGKWSVQEIYKHEMSYGTTAYEPVYKCSACGNLMESYLRYDEPIMPEDADFPRFCPNCGADMREES